jgi:hypothetical protein
MPSHIFAKASFGGEYVISIVVIMVTIIIFIKDIKHIIYFILLKLRGR